MSNEETKLQKQLAAALVVAITKARGVEKDGENKHHRYKYASSETMIDEGRSAMSSAGLTLMLTELHLVPLPLPLLVGERAEDNAIVPIARATFVLIHESGESMSWMRDWPVLEGKGRPLDKVHAGAVTTMLAYAIRDVLLIPRSDELAKEYAMDRRDDRDHVPARDQPKEEPQRDERPGPAKTQERPREEEKQPNAPANDLARGDVYLGLLKEIQAGHLEAMESRIKSADLGREQAAVLFYVLDAYEAPDEVAFGKVGAAIRGDANIKGAWEQAAVDAIRPAFQALRERRKAS
jgi:hypothetical protein